MPVECCKGDTVSSSPDNLHRGIGVLRIQSLWHLELISARSLQRDIRSVGERSTNWPTKQTRVTLSARGVKTKLKSNTEIEKEEVSLNRQQRNYKCSGWCCSFFFLKPTLVFSLFLPLTCKGSVNGDTSGEPSEGGQEENKETRKRGLCEEGGLK